MNKQCIMMDGFSIDRCMFNLHPRGVNKPQRALWTCTYTDNLSEIGWLEWCYYNQPDWIQNELYLITPKKEVKVYEITTLEDYKSDELIKLPNNDIFTSQYIDYEAMADKGYDGIHFSTYAASLGHAFTLFSDDESTMNISMALNPIDCESTVWFNTDWISSVELIVSNLKDTMSVNS
jgi:hypothetical protein